jgi:glutamate-1-semialdehyde 2,1-aminomutase
MNFNHSSQLYTDSQNKVPGGVHSPVRSFSSVDLHPLFIKSANQNKIYDEDGNSFIDFCMSFGPLILGHRNPHVEEEVLQAVKDGWTYGACEKYSLELAEFILGKIPSLDKIRFMNSGTEAVMTALRIARGYTGRDKIIKFNGCYHGHVDSMLIKSGSGLAGQSEASSKGISKAIVNDTIVIELGDQEAVSKVFEQYKDQIAAIIIEPQPANYGLLHMDKSFLTFLRDITKKNHSLLIFDEVISGFRCSFGGIAEQTNITPDLRTYGKIIGGGFPVGAVAGSKDIMDLLAPIGPIYQAGTLSANPLAMRAGLANLKQLTDETYSLLNETTQEIAKVFQKYIDSQENLKQYQIQINHKDSLIWFHPHKKNISSIQSISKDINEYFNHFFLGLIHRGIYLAPNAYEVGFISTAHSGSGLEELKERLLG